MLVTQCDQLCCPDTRGCLPAGQGAGDCQSTTLPNGKASVMCFCDSDKSVLLSSFDEANDECISSCNDQPCTCGLSQNIGNSVGNLLGSANNLANNFANNFANNVANALGPSIKCYEGDDDDLTETTCLPGFVCVKSVEEGETWETWET